MSLIVVQWRGEQHRLEICRPEAASRELMERWGGAVVIERIFEIDSPSSHRARCHLANTVLTACGESLRLDPSLSADELSAQLQALSPNAPPCPKPKERVMPNENENDPIEPGDAPPRAPEEIAAARLAELKAKPVHELTGAEKRELAHLQEPPPEAREVPEIAQLDPRVLTGQQKQMLAGRAPLLKPKSRQVLTADGRDPRTLTGEEKRMLGMRRRPNVAAKPSAPPPPVTGLGSAEQHELGMLRAFQPAEVTDAETGAAPVDAGDELRIRRGWQKPKVKPRKPPPIGVQHSDDDDDDDEE